MFGLGHLRDLGNPMEGDARRDRYFILNDLSGIDFERLIVRLLSRMGFQAEMTKAKNMREADHGRLTEVTDEKQVIKTSA